MKYNRNMHILLDNLPPEDQEQIINRVMVTLLEHRLKYEMAGISGDMTTRLETKTLSSPVKNIKRVICRFIPKEQDKLKTGK